MLTPSSLHPEDGDSKLLRKVVTLRGHNPEDFDLKDKLPSLSGHLCPWEDLKIDTRAALNMMLDG
jgi:hypothetical protein